MKTPEIIALIKGETIGPFGDFRSKKGKPFTASVRLKNNKVDFMFADSTADLDIDSIKSSGSLGKSPIDQTDVYETQDYPFKRHINITYKTIAQRWKNISD